MQRLIKILASVISRTPTATLTSTDIESGLNELDSKTVHKAGDENIAGVKSFTNGTAAIGTTTGALIVSGGIGVGGTAWANQLATSSSIICNGNLYAGSALQSKDAIGTDVSASNLQLRAGTSTGNAVPAAIVFSTSDSNSSGSSPQAWSEKARISSSGNLLVNTTVDTGEKLRVSGNATITGVLGIGANANSTSTTTGSLIIGGNGGLGVGGAIYAGGSINSSQLFAGGLYNCNTILGASTVGVNAIAAALTISTGAGSGSGLAANISFRTDNTGSSGSTGHNTSEKMRLVGDTGALLVGASFDNTLAQLQVSGNIFTYSSFLGNIFASRSAASGVLNAQASDLLISTGLGTGNASPTNILFSTSDAVASGTTSQTLSEKARLTGAGNLLVGVGADGGQKLQVLGTFRATGIATLTNTTSAISTTTGALVVSGGVGVSGNAYLAGLVVTGNSTAQGTIYSNNGTISTNTSSGALVVGNGGGVGIAGAIYTGGLINAAGAIQTTNTTASTNTTTGALVVSGGVGIGGSLYVGGLVSVPVLAATSSASFGGTSSFAGTATFSSLLLSNTITSRDSGVGGTNSVAQNLLLNTGLGTGSGAAASIVFSTDDTTTSGTTTHLLSEKMRINTEGNLLIGTTTSVSASAKLQVAGNTYFSGTTTVNNLSVSNNASSSNFSAPIFKGNNSSNGTNQVAPNLIIQAGTSTGNAIPAIISFLTSDITVSGTSVQNLTQKFQIASNGATANQYNLSALNTPPATATSAGVLGEMRWDGNYHYICVAANTWKRSAIYTTF